MIFQYFVMTSKLDQVAYINFIAYLSSMKFGVCVYPMKYPFLEIALISLSVFHSTLHGVLQSCSTFSLTCQRNTTDNLQMRVCRFIDLLTVLSFEEFDHCRNLVSLFYNYCVGSVVLSLRSRVLLFILLTIFRYYKVVSDKSSKEIIDLFDVVCFWDKRVKDNSFFTTTFLSNSIQENDTLIEVLSHSIP